MSNSGRPLSPHLSVYRWPVTMTVSILHRVSGIALSLGLLVFAWWLIAASTGPEAWEQFLAFVTSAPGQFMLLGWSAAFFFHLANGIRHLVWDLGYGFELKTADASAWFVLLVTVILTAAYWVLT